MWIELSEWAKNMKISVFYMNFYQRVTLAERDFNNLVDSMIHSLGTSQTYHCPMVSWTKRAGMEVVGVLSNIDFYPSKSVWLWPPLNCPICQQPENNTELLLWSHFLGWSASSPVAGWLHQTTSIMEVKAFCSFSNSILWMWICLSSIQCFCHQYHLWT